MRVSVNRTGRTRAFTLVELFVVIAIIAILASLLLPALGRAKGLAHLAKCKSNERQMGLGLTMYLGDWGFYPGGTPVPVCDPPNHYTPAWFNRLEPYTDSTPANQRGQPMWKQPLYDCPGFDFKPGFLLPAPQFFNRGEYAYNVLGTDHVGESAGSLLPGGWISRRWGLGTAMVSNNQGPTSAGFHIPESKVLVPSDMVAIGDAYDEPNRPLEIGLTVMPGYHGEVGTAIEKRARVSTRRRHTGVFNVLFCDGHVEHMKPSVLFGRKESQLRRLNNDNNAHLESLDAFQPVGPD